MHLMIQSMDEFLHISLEDQYDFIIKTATDSLNRFMLPEKRYRDMLNEQQNRKKRKSLMKKLMTRYFYFL